MDMSTNKQQIKEFHDNRLAPVRWFYQKELHELLDIYQGYGPEILLYVRIYSCCLKKEVGEFGECGMSFHNARSKAFSRWQRAVGELQPNPCSRCGGTGIMPFTVRGGVCFKCGGSGRG